MGTKTTSNEEGTATPETTISEEAASLVAGLGDETYGIEALDSDDDDIVSISQLLALDVNDSTDTEDSSTEIEEETDAEGTDGDPLDGESADADDAEGANPDDTTEGDSDSEEEGAKAVKESSNIRVLRQGQKFRKEIEPIIASVRGELPEVVGIATALKASPKDAIVAIRGYSESAAAGLEAAILEEKAAAYIANKHGIEAGSLEAVLKGGEAMEISDGLKEEIGLLTEEGKKELADLLKKSPVEGEKFKRLEGQLQQAVTLLQQERVGSMQEKVDEKFAGFVKALKIEGDLDDLSEAMAVKLSKDKEASAAYNRAATSAAEGRRADAKRDLDAFYRHLADYTKKLKPAAVVEAEAPKAKSKPPAVKPATEAKAKAATAQTTRQPQSAGKGLDAHLLNFAKAKAKELGIAWQG